MVTQTKQRTVFSVLQDWDDDDRWIALRNSKNSDVNLVSDYYLVTAQVTKHAGSELPGNFRGSKIPLEFAG